MAGFNIGKIVSQIIRMLTPKVGHRTARSHKSKGSGNAANRWVKKATPQTKRDMGGKCQHRGCGERRLSKLEFAHVGETPISRTGSRGRKEKLADVHAHPDDYKLKCHKHHISDPDTAKHDANMRNKGARD